MTEPAVRLQGGGGTDRPDLDGARTMKYLLLIYQNEKAWADLSAAERQAIYAEFAPMREQIAKNGNYIAAEKLQDTTTATTVRVRDGKALLTDGPFAETREQLGGF